MNDKNSKITVIIPCYNQPTLLRRCLEALRNQTYKNFVVEIIDDNSTDDYSQVIKDFADIAILYTKNSKNLGAMGNIFNSISKHIETPYKMSLHEDDVLHPDYLRLAIKILDKEATVQFVGSAMSWFKNDEELQQKQQKALLALPFQYSLFDAKQFVIKILKGIHFGLGSVVYRSDITEHTKFDLETFSVLCDRPYLVKLIGQKECAVVAYPGIFVRDHGKNDNRGDAVTHQHIFNLFIFYKSFIQTKNELALFFRHSTNNILYGYHRLINDPISFRNYTHQADQKGLLNYFYLNAQGILGIIKALTKR